MSCDERRQEALVTARESLRKLEGLAGGAEHQPVIAQHVGGAGHSIVSECEGGVDLDRLFVLIDGGAEAAFTERCLGAVVRLGSGQRRRRGGGKADDVFAATREIGRASCRERV